MLNNRQLRWCWNPRKIGPKATHRWCQNPCKVVPAYIWWGWKRCAQKILDKMIALVDMMIIIKHVKRRITIRETFSLGHDKEYSSLTQLFTFEFFYSLWNRIPKGFCFRFPSYRERVLATNSSSDSPLAVLMTKMSTRTIWWLRTSHYLL